MPWPFTSVIAPNLDTTPGVDVPTILTVITALESWLTGAHFTNAAVTTAQVTVKDGSGKVLVQLSIPPGGEQPYEWPFRPVTGVSWISDTAGVLGHLWGYK